MKFVAAPTILAVLAAGTAVDAILAPPKATHAALLKFSQQYGWMLGSTLRGGSMGKNSFRPKSYRHLKPFVTKQLTICIMLP